VDAEQLATNVILASLNQIFRYQFFHADLHPGNLMALPGNVVGFVDFGLCDELDPIVRERQMRSLYAIATDNPELMYRALTEILIPSDETDLERFRRDFLDQTSDWQRQRTSPAGMGEGSTSRYQRSPTSQWMIN